MTILLGLLRPACWIGKEPFNIARVAVAGRAPRAICEVQRIPKKSLSALFVEFTFYSQNSYLQVSGGMTKCIQ
jgi:hypothetical protein